MGPVGSARQAFSVCKKKPERRHVDTAETPEKTRLSTNLGDVQRASDGEDDVHQVAVSARSALVLGDELDQETARALKWS